MAARAAWGQGAGRNGKASSGSASAADSSAGPIASA
jgi:hypothetical protein